MLKIITVLTLLISLNSFAEKGSVTGFEIPRFVSLKSNEINLPEYKEAIKKWGLISD